MRMYSLYNAIERQREQRHPGRSVHPIGLGFPLAITAQRSSQSILRTYSGLMLSATLRWQSEANTTSRQKEYIHHKTIEQYIYKLQKPKPKAQGQKQCRLKVPVASNDSQCSA